jgi:DNA invertase Pin-like site-specific DNA recombinase
VEPGTTTRKSKRIRLLDRLRFVQTPFEGKKAALYIRVSQDEYSLNEDGKKEERPSVATQRADAIAYAKSKGWAYEVYDKDSDLSGFDDFTQRPDLNRLIQDIQAGRIHTVICREVKRLVRSEYLLSYLVNEILVPHGVNLVALTESVDIKTPDGRMMLGFRGHIGQNELFYTAEKSTRSKDQRAKEGRLRTTPAYGYGIMETDGVRKGYIKEPEAAIIRDLFRRCADGEGMQSILHDFIQRGVKPRRSRHLDTGNMCRWVRNPVYIKEESSTTARNMPAPIPPSSTPTYGRTHSRLSRSDGTNTASTDARPATRTS